MATIAKSHSLASLNLPPFPSDGVNTHCLTLANHCHLKGVEKSQAVEFILQTAQSGLRPGRTLKIGEVTRAVEKSYGEPLPAGGEWGKYSKKTEIWPAHDKPLANRIAADVGVGLATLEEISPVNLSTFETGRSGVAEYLVHNLYPDGRFICVGKSMADFHTDYPSVFCFDPLTRQEPKWWLHTLPLIVPSPMKSKTGLTQDGKVSEHTLDATDKRRFIVVEFDDEPDFDKQASLALNLSRSMPLALSLHSGGKSLHSWFYVRDKEEDHIRRWFNYAVSLGADKAGWVRSQFMRMPGGLRRDKPRNNPTYGAFQKPIFFDPTAITDRS